MLGIASMVLFNLVDTFYVARLGATHLAALSFTYPVVLVVNSLALGLGIGASAVISRAVGRGDSDRIRRLTTDSLSLALLVVALFIIAGFITLDPVFRLLGARGEALVLVKTYMRIWFPGMLFVVIPMVGNNAIRAVGDMLTPGLIMLASAVLNMILDPLLIFGIGPFPRLEIAGAALATVISRSCSMALALTILIHRERMITFSRTRLSHVLKSWSEILHLGLPAAATRLVVPLGIGVITRLAAGYGVAAVAALGVGSRIEFFGLAVIMALSSVMGPFCGQNIGAGRLHRVRAGLQWAGGFALIYGAALAVVLALLARPIATLFNDDAAIVTEIVRYLRLVPWAYGAYGLLMISGSVLTVFKRPFMAAGLTVLQSVFLLIPLAWWLSRHLALSGVFLALALSYLFSGVLSAFAVRRVMHMEMKTEMS